jgi:hypothetical protein
VHVHCIPVCVAVQTELGPHWAFDEQLVQLLFTHTWPGLHWLFVVQVEQPVRHGVQTMYGWHIEMPPVWQYEPILHWAFEVHWPGRGDTTQLHCCPAGQLEHCAVQRPPWQVANAGQSAFDWHFGTQLVVVPPGRTLQTSGDAQVTLAQEGGGAPMSGWPGKPVSTDSPGPVSGWPGPPVSIGWPEPASIGGVTFPQCPADCS